MDTVYVTCPASLPLACKGHAQGVAITPGASPDGAALACCSDAMTAEQIAEAQRLAREWKPKTGSQ